MFNLTSKLLVQCRRAPPRGPTDITFNSQSIRSFPSYLLWFDYHTDWAWLAPHILSSYEELNPVLSSSLNGSNGEWTGSDDLAARHGQHNNLLNRGNARRGGNQYGPPLGARPVHPDNRRAPHNFQGPTDPNAAYGNGEFPDEEPGQWGRHSNGAFASVSGSFLARVVDDINVPIPAATSAGQRHGAYNSGVIGAEGASRQGERRLVTDDMARETRVLGDINRDLSDASLLSTGVAVNEADRVSYATLRARHNQEALYTRRVHHAQKLQEKQDEAIVDEAIRVRQLEDANLMSALQAKLDLEISSLVSELSIAVDPRVLAAQDAKIRADCDSLKRNAAVLREANVLKHELAELLENGPVKAKFSLQAPTIFETPRTYVGGRLNSPFNPDYVGKAAYMEAVVNVPLAAGIVFCRRKQTSWAQYLVGGLATMWKRTVTNMDPKVFASWDKQWIAPTNHRDLYASRDGFLGTTSLLRSSDRRTYRSILADYKILGFQCQTLFNLMNAGEDFIRCNDFTHTLTKWVHPTLYQEIMCAMAGIKITVNSIDQICRDAAKNWCRFIPMTLMNDTIELACQHTAIFNHGRNQTAPKLKSGLGTM
jgi:hypothetical protein